MPKLFSGKQVVKILEKKYFFTPGTQKGSHLKLFHVNAKRRVMTVVPLHKELSHGTLRGVLDLAEIDYKDFLDKARNK